MEIGPAHASADEAAAAAVNTRGAGHNLEVIVSDAKGNIVASWHEASEICVGNRARGTRLGHTEQKALLRVRLMEGVHIEMRGHYPPCNGQEGCRNALQVIADETGARISYRNLSVPRSDASVTEFIRSGVPESER